jgi:hypothetical protein
MLNLELVGRPTNDNPVVVQLGVMDFDVELVND